MALIKCAECGKEVSTAADACPNCGAPRKRLRAGTSPWTIIGWVIVGFMCLLMYGCYQAFKPKVDANGEVQSASANDVQPTTLSAPATQEADGCSISSIAVDGTNGRNEKYATYVTGTIKNNCSSLTGVQIKFTVRDAAGGVLTSRDLWPASVSNIPAQGQFPFEVQLDKLEGAHTFETQILQVRDWGE